MGKYLLFLVLILGFSFKTLASEDEKKKKPIDKSLALLQPQPSDLSIFSMQMLGKLTPEDLYKRTQYILLQHYKFKPEDGYGPQIAALSGKQDLAGYNQLLKVLDPKKQFDRFVAFNATSGVVKGFQDRDAREVDDFQLSLSSQQNRTKPFEHFSPTPNQPLSGLRIALDPGHMGGKIWDERTGKWVTDHKGHTLSEGVLNLQTCLLLKERFEKLGATVMVTHETLGPVATVKWEDLDLSKYQPEEMQQSVLESWFLDLVAREPEGPLLDQLFNRSASARNIFSESMRHDFYVLKEDLYARSKLIGEFNPDITLIIHYDTSDPKDDRNGVGTDRRDATKVYVPGGFEATEFATRAQRRDFALHAFDPVWFQASVDLSRSVLTHMETGLNLKPDRGIEGNQVALQDGLIARNLNLTRTISNTALAYVECLFYNDPVEFTDLIKTDFKMNIGNVPTTYSKRLVKVVDSLEAGVLSFVNSPIINKF